MTLLANLDALDDAICEVLEAGPVSLPRLAHRIGVHRSDSYRVSARLRELAKIGVVRQRHRNGQPEWHLRTLAYMRAYEGVGR